MANLYRSTSDLVEHAHRTLDQGERAMDRAQSDLKKMREVLGVVAVFAYIAALAAVAAVFMLDSYVKRVARG